MMSLERLQLWDFFLVFFVEKKREGGGEKIRFGKKNKIRNKWKSV